MNSSQIEQYLGFLGQKLAEMQIKTSWKAQSAEALENLRKPDRLRSRTGVYSGTQALFWTSSGRPRHPGDSPATQYAHEGSSLVDRERVHPKHPASFKEWVYGPGHRPLLSKLA